MGSEAGKDEGRQTTNSATASVGKNSGGSISEMNDYELASSQLLWRSEEVNW